MDTRDMRLQVANADLPHDYKKLVLEYLDSEDAVDSIRPLSIFDVIFGRECEAHLEERARAASIRRKNAMDAIDEYFHHA